MKEPRILIFSNSRRTSATWRAAASRRSWFEEIPSGFKTKSVFFAKSFEKLIIFVEKRLQIRFWSIMVNWKRDLLSSTFVAGFWCFFCFWDALELKRALARARFMLNKAHFSGNNLAKLTSFEGSRKHSESYNSDGILEACSVRTFQLTKRPQPGLSLLPITQEGSKLQILGSF